MEKFASFIAIPPGCLLPDKKSRAGKYHTICKNYQAAWCILLVVSFADTKEKSNIHFILLERLLPVRCNYNGAVERSIWPEVSYPYSAVEYRAVEKKRTEPISCIPLLQELHATTCCSYICCRLLSIYSTVVEREAIMLFVSHESIHIRWQIRATFCRGSEFWNAHFRGKGAIFVHSWQASSGVTDAK